MTERSGVGATEVRGRVTGPGGDAELTFIVDSGAMYTLVPDPVWREIGLQPSRRERFALADSTAIWRDMSECFISLPDLGERSTPVILGEPGDVALLGVVTLEELGLVLNPLTRTLHPARHLLLHIA